MAGVGRQAQFLDKFPDSAEQQWRHLSPARIGVLMATHRLVSFKTTQRTGSTEKFPMLSSPLAHPFIVFDWP